MLYLRYKSVTGKVDKGEDPQHAARREAREEVKLAHANAANVYYCGFTHMNGFLPIGGGPDINHIYGRIISTGDTVEADGDEVTGLKWVPMEEMADEWFRMQRSPHGKMPVELLKVMVAYVAMTKRFHLAARAEGMSVVGNGYWDWTDLPISVTGSRIGAPGQKSVLEVAKTYQAAIGALERAFDGARPEECAVYVDLDMTLVVPEDDAAMNGSDVIRIRHLMRQGVAIGEAEQISNRVRQLAWNTTKAMAPESGKAAEFVEALKSRGWQVMGLTSRKPEWRANSTRNLEDIGVAFDDTPIAQNLGDTCHHDDRVAKAVRIERSIKDTAVTRVALIDDALPNIKQLRAHLVGLRTLKTVVGLLYEGPQQKPNPDTVLQHMNRHIEVSNGTSGEKVVTWKDIA